MSMFANAVEVLTEANLELPDLPNDFSEAGGGSGNQPAGGPGGSSDTTLVKSSAPRGLAIKAIRADKSFEGTLIKWLNKQQELYFVSVAFDLSEAEPVVLPPEASKLDSVYRADVGAEVEFAWGSGAPLFPARVISGGLLVYVTLMEKDSGKHIGEILEKIHKDLKEDGSVLARIKDMIKNPGGALTKELLSVGAAALQPIATVLKESSDDYIGVFQGFFGSKDVWSGHLVQSQNGATVALQELGSGPTS